MPDQIFPVSGWRNSTIRVPRKPGALTLLQLRSRGPVTSFSVTAVIDDAREYTEYPGIVQTRGAGSYPFIVPTRYTHVRVERGKGEGNGFGRWHLDLLDVQALPVLEGRLSGVGYTAVLWPGKSASFRYDFPHKNAHKWSGLAFHRAHDGETESLEQQGHTRGTATLPGPGYLHVQTAGEWNIALE